MEHLHNTQGWNSVTINYDWAKWMSDYSYCTKYMWCSYAYYCSLFSSGTHRSSHLRPDMQHAKETNLSILGTIIYIHPSIYFVNGLSSLGLWGGGWERWSLFPAVIGQEAVDRLHTHIPLLHTVNIIVICIYFCKKQEEIERWCIRVTVLFFGYSLYMQHTLVGVRFYGFTVH